jgi:hypothetical protein
MKRLEKAYKMYVLLRKDAMTKDLPFYKLFIESLQLPVKKSEKDIIHLFEKFNFLHFCLHEKNTKNINPLLALQYFEVRKDMGKFIFKSVVWS